MGDTPAVGVMGRISLGVLPGMSPGGCLVPWGDAPASVLRLLSFVMLETAFPVGGEEVEVVAEALAEGLQADVLAAGGDELAVEFLLESLL